MNTFNNITLPNGWEVKRVKELGRVVLGKMLCDKPQKGFELKPYLKAKNINWLALNLNSVEEMYFSKEEMKIYKLQKDDLILTEGGEVGRTTIWNNEIPECYLQNSVHKITLNRKICNPRYYMYLSFSMGGMYDSYITFISIKHLTSEKLKNVKWILPPLPIQTRIAAYLDEKTAQIDHRIALLNAKADKYRTLRRSIINQAVTQGLEPNPVLKPSGIKWIENIPQGWEIVRMKDIGFLYSGLSGKSGDDFENEDNPNNKKFIQFTNIFNNDIIDPNKMGSVVINENEKQNKVKKNDLFFLMSSEDYDGLGKCSLLKDELTDTYLNSFCKGFRIIKKNVCADFINYQLESFTFRNLMMIEGKGFTRMNLKSEKITSFSIPLPPLSIQTRIAAYLDEKTAQIDAMVSNIQKQVEQLSTLRRSIINQAVTGQISEIIE